MNRVNRVFSSAIVFVVVAVFAGADEDIDKELAAQLESFFGTPVLSIAPTPFKDIVQIELPDLIVLYASRDGRHIFNGSLYAINDEGEAIDLKEAALKNMRLARFMEAESTESIVFASAKTPSSAVIHVFTDVDCGYCRELHSLITDYNDLGVEVRYLAFPRAGIGSETYDRMVSAWCADNPQKAMTQLKTGKSIASRTCLNPVAEQYQLGQALGVQGTPAILLSDGRLLPGFVPPTDLIKQL